MSVRVPITIEQANTICIEEEQTIVYRAGVRVEDEGYPDLVVQGPLTATRLYEFAEAVTGRSPISFSFRGEAPTFVNQPVRLVTRLEGSACKLRAGRVGGVACLQATATF